MFGKSTIALLVALTGTLSTQSQGDALLVKGLARASAATASFVTLDATDFDSRGDFYVDGYYLAIDPLSDPDQKATATESFPGEDGVYNIKFYGVGEEDGESIYKMWVDNNLVGEYQVPQTSQNFEEGEAFNMTWAEVSVNNGDEIKVEAAAHSNGSIPEDGAPGGHAWSRGRWYRIEFDPQDVAVNPITVEITSPDAAATFAEGSTVPVSVTASGDGTSITGIALTLDGESAGSSSSGSLSTDLTDVAVGSHTLEATATDNQGNDKSTTVQFSVYDPNSIHIEAEDYTSMSGVETESCQEGGSNIGYIDAGDWAEYSVSVPETGVYNITIRAACQSGTSTIEIVQGGQTVGTIVVNSTGDWQSWESTTGTATLTAGVPTIRFVFVTGGMNMNWLAITPTDATMGVVRNVRGTHSLRSTQGVSVYNVLGVRVGATTGIRTGNQRGVFVRKQGTTVQRVIGK